MPHLAPASFSRLLLNSSIAILLFTGCRSLQPIDLPDEIALSPVNHPVWEAMESVHPGNGFLLLNEGGEAFEWRLRMIDSATGSLDLQTFLWKQDHIGLRLFSRILAAADRGVRVRLLVDDSFTFGENDLIFNLDQHPNISFRIYNPFRRRYDSASMRELMNAGEFSRLNHRMHNKVMLVDNQITLIGGRNLADEYFGYHSQGNFRDMELICFGPVTEELSTCFDLYWNSNWSFPAAGILKQPSKGSLSDLRKTLRVKGTDSPTEGSVTRAEKWIELAGSAASGEAALFYDTPAEINPASPEESPGQLAVKLLERLRQAEKELILVSAYLIPTPELEQKVEAAEKRGVSVKILTNSLRSNNHMTAHSAYRGHLRRLVNHGADVHEVRAKAKDRQQYMLSPVNEKNLGLHAKLLLMDERFSFIGSANLDPRSLHLNTEIGLLLDSPEINRQLRNLLELDFDLRNAWHLEQAEKGDLVWVADDLTLTNQPADSDFQRLEDWFLGILPIENEM